MMHVCRLLHIVPAVVHVDFNISDVFRVLYKSGNTCELPTTSLHGVRGVNILREGKGGT